MAATAIGRLRGLVGRSNRSTKKARGSSNKRVAEVLANPLKEEGKKINSRQTEIARTLRSLRAERKKLTKKKRDLATRKKQWKEDKAKIAREIKEIKQKLPIKVIRVVNETQPSKHPIILIETKMLTCYRKSWRGRKIGNFLIRLDPFAKQVKSKVRIANLWKRVYRKDSSSHYDHTCIRNSKLCLGNTHDDFLNLFKEREIFGLVELAIDFLRTNRSTTPFLGWDKWFDQIRPLPKAAELFPDRDYALVSLDDNPLGTLFVRDVHTEAASTWRAEYTSAVLEPTNMRQVGWEEYQLDLGGNVRTVQRVMAVAPDAPEQEIIAQEMRQRISQLSRELAELQSRHAHQGTVARSALPQYESSPVRDVEPMSLDDVARATNELNRTLDRASE